MKYIEETHKEIRKKAAESFWEARHYSQKNDDVLEWQARAQYYAYAIAALKLKNGMFRERCAAKG